VILVEGAGAYGEELRVDVIKNNALVFSSPPLHVSLSGVTDMYRWINLRPVCGDNTGMATQTNEPPNNPDALSNGKNVVYIHGFNESANDGLANGSEIFKRLYWSGSRAKYTGVTWRGDQYGFPSGALRYHADVTNAFITAPYYAAYVTNLAGEVNLLAYSLGNMVVSSAIEDFGVGYDRYFLIHAAVAKEAYDGNEYASNMVERGWVDYTNRLYASEWHTLFPTNDGRSRLTWRGRFSSVVGANVYNFYSSEDDVLDNSVAQMSFGQTVLDHILHWDFNFRRYAWSCQELYKGRQADWQAGTPYGGWGFVESSSTTNYFARYYDWNTGTFVFPLWSPAQAAGIAPEALKAQPFFNSVSFPPSVGQV